MHQNMVVCHVPIHPIFTTNLLFPVILLVLTPINIGIHLTPFAKIAILNVKLAFTTQTPSALLVIQTRELFQMLLV
jgi:hypothetical protein